jgi:hypothetical protein
MFMDKHTYTYIPGLVQQHNEGGSHTYASIHIHTYTYIRTYQAVRSSIMKVGYIHIHTHTYIPGRLQQHNGQDFDHNY